MNRPCLTIPAVTVWRSATDLQIGEDDRGCTLHGVPHQVERLIRALDGFHDHHLLEHICPEPWLSWTMRRLEAQGWLVDGPPAPVQFHLASLVDSPFARRLTSMLTHLMSVPAQDSSGASDLTAQPAAHRFAQAAAHRPDHPGAHRPDPPGAHRHGQLEPTADLGELRPMADLGASTPPVTIVAATTVEPDRVSLNELTRSGRRHLVIRLNDTRARVGPFVFPGKTSCVGCDDRAQRDADPTWPLRLFQLAQIQAEPHPVLTAWALGLAATQLLSHASGHIPQATSTIIQLSLDDGRVTYRRQPWHDQCPCRDRGGSQGSGVSRILDDNANGVGASRTASQHSNSPHQDQVTPVTSHADR
ncbi:MAG: hypothetical protein LBV06_10325 [Propionibacteriaceae bacterium]|nr:hypothetical protein [Propionibacteriaceae bacterium]